MNKNIFYVYGYKRSKDSINGKAGTFYYFGKGKGNRAYKEHRYNGCGVHTPKDKNDIVFIAENLSEEEAFILEIEMISQFGRIDLGTGVLRNLTDGGEGISGKIFSDAERLALSVRSSGENNPWFGVTGENHPLFGRKHTEDTKEKIRITKIGILNPMYGKLKENNPNFGRKRSEETKEKLRKPLSLEHRDKLRGKRGTQTRVTCPHCGLTGGISAMNKSHFNQCKLVADTLPN